MEQLIQQVIVAAVGVSLLGAAYLLDLFIGVVKVLFTPDLKWSTKKMGQDLIKAVLWAAGTVAFVALLNAVEWYGTKVGADLSFLGAASFPALLISVLGGIGWYMSGAAKNIAAFIKNKNAVSVDESKANYAEIVEATKNIIDGLLGNEKASEAEAEPTDEEINEIGQGGNVDPLARVLPDGDNDNGKGWQCSKYSWYLASGVRMNYAPHPDYGPCNGNDMVDYLVDKLGWVRCGKEKGAIFSVMTGQYGHTGIVLDPATNRINNANWTPLKVSTNQPYSGLDLASTKFCKPAGYNPIPEPAPSPPPSPSPAPQPVDNDPKPELNISASDDARLNAVINVIRGTYGNGAATRQAEIVKLGLDYNDIQKQVNLNLRDGHTRVGQIRLY
jgi:hypothetical protein